MNIPHLIRSAFGVLCLSFSVLAGAFRRRRDPSTPAEAPIAPPPPTIPYTPERPVRRLVSRDLEALNNARHKRARKAQKRLRDAEACGQ